MEYSVSDFLDLLEMGSINPASIRMVTHAWGEREAGQFTGGFCIQFTNGDWYRIEKIEDPYPLVVFGPAEDPQDVAPPFRNDFVLPCDVLQWLEDGADPGNVHEY